MRVSLESQALRLLLRAFVKRDLCANAANPEAYVAAMRRACERSPTRRVPPDLRVVTLTRGEVRGEWVLQRGAPVGERAILYVHGGGMVACRPPAFRGITSALARLTGVPVFVPDYRHAPEHRYPAALDDVLAAYRAMRVRVPAGGIVLAGDSAGGNLALAALLALRQRSEQRRPAAALVALSPWTDLLGTGASLESNRPSEDVLAGRRGEGGLAYAYTDAAHFSDPLVSPLYGDFTGGPPMLLFASSTEVLLDDSRALAARARAQGVLATLVQGASMPHAWPVFAHLPEARRAHVTIADFCARAWSACA